MFTPTVVLKQLYKLYRNTRQQSLCKSANCEFFHPAKLLMMQRSCAEMTCLTSSANAGKPTSYCSEMMEYEKATHLCCLFDLFLVLPLCRDFAQHPKDDGLLDHGGFLLLLGAERREVLGTTAQFCMKQLRIW